ncbi:MAG: hypothetical protein JW801_04975 [Bacteroidales bacterium]|nr:hypothetical protein [Bacteroidales bacterium]
MKTLYTLLLAIIISVTALAQNKADLKYNLELNKVYRVKNIAIQSMVQTVQGNEQNIETSNTVVFSLKPLKILEGEMIAEVRFDTIITLVSMPPMEVNSSNPGDINSSDAGEIMTCIMNRMSNSTFLVEMTNTGRVVKFMNLAAMQSGILQGIDSLKGPMAAGIQERAKMLVEESALKGMIESVTVYLPGREVKTGETWDILMDLSSGGMTMGTTTTFKLQDIEKGVAVLSSDIVIESKPVPMETNGMKITPDISGLGKSTLNVDTGTGWIVSGTARQQMKGELSLSAPGGSMQIPIQINSESEFIAIP